METPSPYRADLSHSPHGQQPLTEEVQRMLRVEFLRETRTAPMVASLYSVSRRTLSRHLKAEGRTFRQIANEVRGEIACMLLVKTDLSVGQIAEVMNYSENSTFTRA